jgi:hypothetical protein
VELGRCRGRENWGEAGGGGARVVLGAPGGEVDAAEATSSRRAGGGHRSALQVVEEDAPRECDAPGF